MQNRITVAVKAYSNEASIEAALKSALGQSMPGVEVIVVNDCSGDDTEEVIAAVSQQQRVSARLCTGTDLQVCGEPVGVGHG